MGAESRDESRAVQRETRAERDESRAKAEAEAEVAAQNQKPAEFCAKSVREARAGMAGEARSLIGARHYARCGRHARTKRGTHLAPLTPLTGAAHMRGRMKRAREGRTA